MLDSIKSISNSLATFVSETLHNCSMNAQSVSGLRLDTLPDIILSVERKLKRSILAKSVSVFTLDKIQGILLSLLLTKSNITFQYTNISGHSDMNILVRCG